MVLPTIVVAVAHDGGSYTPVTPSGSGYTWPIPGHTALSSVFGEDRGTYGHGAIDISRW